MGNVQFSGGKLKEVLPEVVGTDDKAHIPLGIVAVKKQRHIVTHLAHKVRLPDHDFRVGSKQILVPSVVGSNLVDDSKIMDRSAVSYKGATSVFVRSGKMFFKSDQIPRKKSRKLVEESTTTARLPAMHGILKEWYKRNGKRILLTIKMDKSRKFGSCIPTGVRIRNLPTKMSAQAISIISKSKNLFV